ncbi:MAG: DUF11 domain-containing protein [Propionibacteriaceae bacterium]|nr:DUF11 domain-containing protein [Propionibacteriaceae bacterium]
MRVRLGSGANNSLGGTINAGISSGFSYQLKVLPSAAGSTITTAGRLDYSYGTDASYLLPQTVIAVAAAGADMSITNVLSPRVSAVGSTITSTLTVANAGPGTAQSVQVVDPIINGMQNVSWDLTSAPGFSCTQQPVAGTPSLVCSLAAMTSGSSATIVVSGNLPSNTPASQVSLTNTVSVSSSTSDPDPTNNTSSDTISLTREADLAVTVSPASPTVVPGQQQTYTVTATNNGPSDALGCRRGTRSRL